MDAVDLMPLDHSSNPGPGTLCRRMHYCRMPAGASFEELAQDHVLVAAVLTVAGYVIVTLSDQGTALDEAWVVANPRRPARLTLTADAAAVGLLAGFQAGDTYPGMLADFLDERADGLTPEAAAMVARLRR